MNSASHTLRNVVTPASGGTDPVATAQPDPTCRPDTGWEHFPHDADIGICGRGQTLEQAFEQAALALTRIVTDAEVRLLHRCEVACEAPDLGLLLVEWLNAVVFEMAVRRMLFGRFAVRIEAGTKLNGTLWGEPIDIARHAPACEPKGATCTALRVVREADGEWTATCIVDV
jgi:SHS2 domain-containing protein